MNQTHASAQDPSQPQPPAPAADRAPGADRGPGAARRGIYSLRARMVLIILMALLPAFVLLVAVASLERTRAAEAAASEQMALVRLTRTQYMEMISSTQQLMAWAVLFPEVRSGDSQACSARLQQLFVALADFRGMSVAGRDGAADCVAAATPVTTTLHIGERTYFRNAVQSGRFAIGGLDIGALSGRPSITFGMPILDDDGKVTRVLGAGLDVDILNRRLIGADFPSDAVLLLTDGNGNTILRSSQPEEYVGHIFPIANLVGDGTQAEGVGLSAGVDGVSRQYAWSVIEDGGKPAFYVLVGYETNRIFGGVNRTLLASLIGLALITLVALAVAWLSAESMIVRRIEALVQVARRMREGDLQVRTNMADDSSEFGQLAATLDSMAAALAARIDENERLLGEMTKLNGELEQRVAVRTLQLEATNARLLSSQAELRRLSQELMRATEAERTRIAREIHDQLGQMITAIKMELSTLRRRLAAGGAGVTAKIGDIDALLDESVTLVRRISADLRPGLLDDFGLATAAEWQLKEFQARTGVDYTLNTTLDESAIGPDTATAVFRILQESLTNITRHAQANHVDVTLAMQAGLLTLRVKDNGRGLIEEEQQTRRSLGVLGMRERAMQLGGALELKGAPGLGAEVVLQLPLDEPPDASSLPRSEEAEAEVETRKEDHHG